MTDGVTAVQLHARLTEHEPWQQNGEGPNLYPDKQMRQRDTAAIDRVKHEALLEPCALLRC